MLERHAATKGQSSAQNTSQNMSGSHHNTGGAPAPKKASQALTLNNNLQKNSKNLHDRHATIDKQYQKE